MKQLYTLSLSFLAITGVHAQITIGQNEMPHANDELVRVQAVTNPFINYNATGPAHTWDFANLAANQGDTTNYQTVASANFVYAIVYADFFFNANRANHAKQGTDIAFSALLPIQNPYTFRYRSNAVYKTVGYGVELSGIPVPITFDQHDVIYELPLDYGNTSASHSAYQVNIPGVGAYAFEQDRTNEVDGWGGITTPGGVFDVLRVKTSLVMRDSIFGFAIDRPVAHEYKWLAQGLRVPVLQINTTTIFGQEVVNAIYYYDVPRSIAVVDPLATTLCPGATLQVHYESTGAFNAGGFFVPANHFTAQLSDATGSFAAPVTIGDVIATGSGTIAATIPANTPPGTGYRIRVISTSPDYTGTSDPFDIIIGGPTTAAITAAGPSLICTGETLTLTAVGGPGYQWQLDGVDIGGATSEIYDATGAGDYTVVVDNACGLATSNTITVEMNQPPAYGVDQLSYQICAGDSATIIAHDQNGQSPVTYQWMLNDAPIAGATDSVVSAMLAGQYTLEVINGTTGCSFITPVVAVVVETVPTPLVTALDSTTFCDGGSVTLTIPATPGSTYQWYMNSLAIADAASTELVVTGSGDYTVVVTSTSGCASGTSAATTVTVDPAPVAPSVTPTEPTTFCEGAGVTLIADAGDDVVYQWYQDGAEIIGGNGVQLTVLTAGSYTVTVTALSGCSATSEAIEVVVHPLPPVPVITGTTDSLLVADAGIYQWYLDGEAIPGATDPWWVPAANGSYTVQVSDPNGCSSLSDPFVWITTGVANLSLANMQVVPNPSNGAFAIQLPGAHGQPYEILDATGKRVRTGSLTSVRTAIDMNTAEQGMYFLRLLQNGSAPVLRIMITR